MATRKRQGVTPPKPRDRKCATCRYYEASPLWRKGWCRNPLLYDPQTNHLVEAESLACSRTFIDYWEARLTGQAGLAADVTPYGIHGSTASSDIGEVSAAVPLAELGVATRPLGTASHHWATTSCSLHPVGVKGMMVAAKVLGASLVDLLADPAAVAAAKAEFAKETKGKAYQSPLAPDAKPMVF